MRWADVYVHAGRRGVALRNRCPQGQADPRAAIDGGASGVTMARAGPHPRLGRRLPGVAASMRWADVYVPHVSPASMSPAGPMAERWLSLSWWWACESRRGRSRRGSGRCSGLSVVRDRCHGRVSAPRQSLAPAQRVGQALRRAKRRRHPPVSNTVSKMFMIHTRRTGATTTMMTFAG